jgi:hypothetical protein
MSQKLDSPVSHFGGSSFYKYGGVRVGFEILFVQKRFCHVRVKELRPAANIYVGHNQL